ncbi:hypothetical protein CEUSTIGMA_g9060.t1 [Chlamydomonas eustigma]|uniref:Uncharacterized protein n=1 Tax=Chlamydomonas eustigma TaxID=1157962 RepID=A0A250XFF1_9CHLO|nr:hypothetical protein CEUSTIGMA_g9060.t1 [Chlamydomonas eustigma]|eukprot:GAX81632.1 hypothetical protein CEUSTIGMA_g9060.t1 [Chlamydomonas eustigma]
MAVKQDAEDAEGEQNNNFFAYSKKTKKVAAGRTSFIPVSQSPGPGAYSPVTGTIKQAAPKASFGTASRDNEAARFISNSHNKALPATNTPGPGTYRIAKAESYERSPKHSFTPAWGFGTAPQRTDEHKEPAAQVPGPKYKQDPPKDAPSYTFAPHGNIELGMSRSRQDTSKVFLSEAHCHADASLLASQSNVGPGQYDVENIEALSPKRKGERAVFGRQHRDARDSMSDAAMRFDPLSTTAAKTPAAIYQYPSQLDKHGVLFSKAPKHYSPELGPASAGPYLSKGHEATMQGNQCPGPGNYDVQGGRHKAVGGLGDGPMYPFGLLLKKNTVAGMLNVPGPGTYNPKESASSTVNAAVSISMAANLRTDFAAVGKGPSDLGPAAYNAIEASVHDARKTKAPSYSMSAISAARGRSSFVPITPSPGPTYHPGGGIDIAKGRGYTFGVKERTVDERSTISVRYHGPLASQEFLCTSGPGPVYDTSTVTKLAGKKELPHFKFGTADRGVGPKLYISRQHGEAEGLGIDSPGPGAYDVNYKDVAEVTSRYSKAANSAFSMGPRFEAKYSTF